MRKKIIIYILLVFSAFFVFLFFKEDKKIYKSEGAFNDIIVVSSIEDRKFLEPIIDKYIFSRSNLLYLNPEMPFLVLFSEDSSKYQDFYRKKWISPEEFKYYKKYSNILIASINTPNDNSIDILVKELTKKHSIQNFPVFIKDVYSSPQLITVISSDKIERFDSLISNNKYYLIDRINNHTDSLFLNRYNRLGMNKLISDSIYNLFNVRMNISNDFNIISNNKHFFKIGKGDNKGTIFGDSHTFIYDDEIVEEFDKSNIRSTNSSFLWITLYQENISDYEENKNLSYIIKNNLKKIEPKVELLLDSLDLLVEFQPSSSIAVKNDNSDDYKQITSFNFLYNHKVQHTGGPLIVYVVNDYSKMKRTFFYGFINAPGRGDKKIEYIKELETIIKNSIF